MDRTSLVGRLRRFARELVVIVVGVLVALTADRWQQSRLERQSEHDYRERLRGDVAEDTVRMIQLVERSVEKRKALAYLETVIAQRPPRDSARALAREMMLASATLEQDFRTTAFEELRSTGRLMILRNQELREAVMAYNEDIERYLPRIERRRSDFGPLLMTYIPPSARMTAIDETMDTLQAPEWAFRFLSDPRLPQAVNAEYRFAEFAGERYERFYAQGVRMLRILDSLEPQ